MHSLLAHIELCPGHYFEEKWLEKGGHSKRLYNPQISSTIERFVIVFTTLKDVQRESKI